MTLWCNKSGMRIDWLALTSALDCQVVTSFSGCLIDKMAL